MPRDEAYLLDMLVAARRAAEHAAGLQQPQFEASLLHQDAVMHELQIVGEAASRVSEATKAEHSQIDWNGIIGLRHRLVHDYRRIRRDVLWHVLNSELPFLVEQLNAIVPPDDAAAF
jgi:uncharacterized protein with HEPN domain